MAWLVGLVVFALFAPTARYAFLNWDDWQVLLTNPHWRGLSPAHLKWMFVTSFGGLHDALYQPLTWLSFGLDHAVWGMNPAGYHLTNAALHALNAVVFYHLSRRLLSAACAPVEDARWLDACAAFSALAFGLHPLRVESVAWVIERKDVLSGLFYLLALLAYVDRRLKIALGCFALALLAKVTTLTLPAALIVLDFYPLRRRAWLEKLPFLALALAAGGLGLAGQSRADALLSVEATGWTTRVAVALYGAAFYVRKTLLPLGLSPLYEARPPLDPFVWRFALSTLTTAGFTAGFVAARRRFPAGLAAWAYYLATLGPVIGLVAIGRQLAADRYSYLSCLGWALLAAGGLYRAGRSRASAAGAASVLLLLAALSARQSAFWRDSRSLWLRALAVDPDCSVAHDNLGAEYAAEGRFDEAVAHLEKALAVSREPGATRNTLGQVLAEQGRLPEAIAQYERALPLLSGAARASAYNNLGVALLRQGRLALAIEQFKAASSDDPDLAAAYYNLAYAAALTGRRDQIEPYFRHGAALDPSLAPSVLKQIESARAR